VPPAARAVGPVYIDVLTHWDATAVATTRAVTPAQLTPPEYQNALPRDSSVSSLPS
jgi:hypothetical protein